MAMWQFISFANQAILQGLLEATGSHQPRKVSWLLPLAPTQLSGQFPITTISAFPPMEMPMTTGPGYRNGSLHELISHCMGVLDIVIASEVRTGE
jgi:hypothetical protein